MNDPREKENFAFGGVNVPYEKIYEGYYRNGTHIDCMYKLGKEIKDRIQVFCFSGARSKGWDNEMMWAHYADDNKGICMELDEGAFLRNLASQDIEYVVDNIDYTEGAERFIYWNKELDMEQNIIGFTRGSIKNLAFKKSKCWKAEDERRLVLINRKNEEFIFYSKRPKDCIPWTRLSCSLRTIY